MLKNFYSQIMQDACGSSGSEHQWFFWPNHSPVAELFGSDEDSLKLLQSMVESTDLPAVVLEELSYHSNADIRIAVSESKNVPSDVLWALALDRDANVRFAVAENHNVDREILQFMLGDENPYVVDRAQRTLYRLNIHESGAFNIAKFPATRAFLCDKAVAAAV